MRCYLKLNEIKWTLVVNLLLNKDFKTVMPLEKDGIHCRHGGCVCTCVCVSECLVEGQIGQSRPIFSKSQAALNAVLTLLFGPLLQASNLK